MLRSMQDLEGHAISATVGTIGQVNHFHFDDSIAGQELLLWPLKSI